MVLRHLGLHVWTFVFSVVIFVFRECYRSIIHGLLYHFLINSSLLAILLLINRRQLDLSFLLAYNNNRTILFISLPFNSSSYNNRLFLYRRSASLSLTSGLFNFFRSWFLVLLFLRSFSFTIFN